MKLEETLIARLRELGGVIATAESCTGGLVASRITDIAGASDVFWGGFAVYDNSAKTRVLGLPAALIEKHGAVSEEVAKRLAESGLEKTRAAAAASRLGNFRKARRFFCVSTTGVAGPGGGSAEKPVGLCFIGVTGTRKKTQVERFLVRPGLTRSEYKSAFAEEALRLALAYLQ